MTRSIFFDILGSIDKILRREKEEKWSIKIYRDETSKDTYLSLKIIMILPRIDPQHIFFT